MRGGRTGWSGLIAIGALCASGCYDGVSVDADGATDAAPGGVDASGGTTSETGGQTPNAASATDETGDGEPLAPDEVVPLDGPQLDVPVHCVDMADDERVVSVSPDGDLWLARENAGQTEVRSVPPGAVSETTAFTLPWASLVAVQALGRTRGVVIADDGFFSWDAERADEIRWPDHLPMPTGFCGDPSVDGDALVFAGDVFTRDIGQWWRWNLPGAALADDVQVAATTGACSGRSGTSYLLRGGTVWGVKDTWVAPLPAFSPSSALAADDGFGLASIVDGDLQIGDPTADEDPMWIQFEAQTGMHLAATPGRLFVATQDRLYAYGDERIEELTSDGQALVVSALHASAAGGVWAETNDGVCHIGPGGGVRVDGLRPYQTRRTNEIDVALEIDGDPQGQPLAVLDGEPADLLELGDGRWALQQSTIEARGWHELVVDVDTSQGEMRRAIEFQVEPLANATWDDDIAPLFEQHCGTAACHGPEPSSDERPDLSQYGVWTLLSASIRDRVGETSDMPPLGAGDGSWGVDEVLLVVGWIDAGLPEEN